jgi:hypothetical protein
VGSVDGSEQSVLRSSLREAVLLEPHTERAQQRNQQPDDCPQNPDATPELQDFRLEPHGLHVEDIRGNHGSVLAPEPTQGRRPGHAEPSDDARVAHRLDEVPQSVVVGPLRSRLGSIHRPILAEESNTKQPHRRADRPAEAASK